MLSINLYDALGSTLLSSEDSSLCSTFCLFGAGGELFEPHPLSKDSFGLEFLPQAIVWASSIFWATLPHVVLGRCKYRDSLALRGVASRAGVRYASFQYFVTGWKNVRFSSWYPNTFDVVGRCHSGICSQYTMSWLGTFVSIGMLSSSNPFASFWYCAESERRINQSRLRTRA